MKYVLYLTKDKDLIEPMFSGKPRYNKQNTHGFMRSKLTASEEQAMRNALPVTFTDKMPKWFKQKSELLKQAIDQPLHFTWAFLAVIIGLNAAPIGYAFIALHVLAIAYREYKQYPPRVWWDLALDISFYTLGFIAGGFYGY